MYQDILVRHHILLGRESSTNGWRAVIWVILQWALPFFHNDNNYLLKNSCAVFSSSSFSLIPCRINVCSFFLSFATCFWFPWWDSSVSVSTLSPPSFTLNLSHFNHVQYVHTKPPGCINTQHIWHELIFLLLPLHRNVCRRLGIRHFHSPQWFFQSAGWWSDDFTERAESLTQKVLQGTRTGEGRHVVSQGGGK